MDLPEIRGEGIALDIDETLSNTMHYWIENMLELFGNPEGLSVEEMAKKYRYTWESPYWQSDEALDWINGVLSDKGAQLDFSVVTDAKDFVWKINDVVPVVAYITARPECVADVTRDWLVKHGFPDVPVICKPEATYGVGGNKWKAGVLKSLYPRVKGIVDDNVKLCKYLDDYDGYVFLYSHELVDDGANGVACVDWEAVYEEVKKKFG